MHVARCVIISHFFLFSLFTICLALSSHLLLSAVLSNAHTVAHYTLFFFFSFFFPPTIFFLFENPPAAPRTSPPFFSFLLFFSPFLPLPLPLRPLLSLSVMAYQDGFYSAADLYVSMPPCALSAVSLPHSTVPPLPPALPVDFKSVKQHRQKPTSRRVFDSVRQERHSMF